MSWTQLAPDRWSMQDADGSDTRHLLLRANGRSIELHGHTVHVYEGPDEVVDPQFPLGVPDPDGNGMAVWLLTDYVNVGSEAEAWAVMAGFEHAEPPGSELPPSSLPPSAPGLPATPPTSPSAGDDDEEL